jgi:8-oxo-dGTP pyrophosphatase MutT (NUDIX family)
VPELDLLPFSDYVRSLNKKRMSAGAVFYDAEDRVLLVELSYVPHWDIPGGTVDAEEAPWTTVAREVREELGLDQPPGRLLVIDYLPTNKEMPEGLAFIFDGGTVTEADVQALAITDPEIVSVGLHALDEAALKVTPALRRRLAAALQASQTGRLALCEDGNPTTE